MIQNFESVAASEKTAGIAKEVRSLLKTLMKWKSHIKGVSALTSGLASQSDPEMDGRLDVPSIKVLQSMIKDLTLSIRESSSKLVTGGIHTILYETPFMSFPDMDRIDPTRTSRRILGAQARFAKSVLHTWIRWDRARNA